MRTILIIFGCCSLFCLSCNAQPLQNKRKFTRQDTLRGSITAERAWWDVLKYDITVKPDYNAKTIRGTNTITCKAISAGKIMQIDLQKPMEITSAVYNTNSLPFKRNGNVYYVDFGDFIKQGDIISLTIQYAGSPLVAVNPPWSGGWIWKKDEKGNPWMTVACQGLGASVWYPCKDHQSDEPDSATLTIVVPDTLVGVGNGRLRSKIKNADGTTSYTWAVSDPINNYNIVPYIGKYVNWAETFQGEKGNLDLNYWVLYYNLERARSQFKQVPLMLKCFEHWFGPYPFYEDGYKMVEAPHLGMEHQGAIAYGNKFENGYLGKDLSGTGWGDKWDFIIVHESGHEWFANNITSKDIADMWIHEGFASYSETLYTTCEYGVEAGNEYCIGTRRLTYNDVPVIGHYDVNQEGSDDMYTKGSNMLHTIRQIINDDEKFRGILRGLNSVFYHQTVTTRQVEDYISTEAGKDFSAVFDQYLRTTLIPVFEYKMDKGTLSFRWTNCVKGFKMPLKILAGKPVWIEPSEEWKSIRYEGNSLEADRNFYVQVKKIK